MNKKLDEIELIFEKEIKNIKIENLKIKIEKIENDKKKKLEEERNK